MTLDTKQASLHWCHACTRHRLTLIGTRVTQCLVRGSSRVEEQTRLRWARVGRPAAFSFTPLIKLITYTHVINRLKQIFLFIKIHQASMQALSLEIYCFISRYKQCSKKYALPQAAANRWPSTYNNGVLVLGTAQLLGTLLRQTCKHPACSHSSGQACRDPADYKHRKGWPPPPLSFPCMDSSFPSAK